MTDASETPWRPQRRPTKVLSSSTTRFKVAHLCVPERGRSIDPIALNSSSFFQNFAVAVRFLVQASLNPVEKYTYEFLKFRGRSPSYAQSCSFASTFID